MGVCNSINNSSEDGMSKSQKKSQNKTPATNVDEGNLQNMSSISNENPNFIEKSKLAMRKIPQALGNQVKETAQNLGNQLKEKAKQAGKEMIEQGQTAVINGAVVVKNKVISYFGNNEDDKNENIEINKREDNYKDDRNIANNESKNNKTYQLQEENNNSKLSREREDNKFNNKNDKSLHSNKDDKSSIENKSINNDNYE